MPYFYYFVFISAIQRTLCVALSIQWFAVALILTDHGSLSLNVCVCERDRETET